jgi:hypothetical protein
MATVGDIANALHLGRHQARRLLVKADLPGKKKIAKGWRGPDGHWYWRTFWVVPEEALAVLWFLHKRPFYAMVRRGLRGSSVDSPLDNYARVNLCRARERLEQRVLEMKQGPKPKK